MSDDIQRVKDILEEYHTKWANCSYSIESIAESFETTIHNDVLQVQESIQKEKQIILRLYKALREHDLLKDSDLSEQFKHLASKVHYGQQVMQQMLYFKTNSNRIPSLFLYNPIEYEKLNPFQKLIYYMYDYFESRNIRKYGEYCYSEICNPYQTKAWKMTKKIIDVVNDEFNMLNNYQHWMYLTSSKDMDKRVAEYLIRAEDPRFPTLKKHRNIFSFKNGIYISLVRSTNTDCFIPYLSERYRQLDDKYISCKYFDIDFTELTDTPVLDSIFRYQKLSDEVIAINKMFLGRMLYKTGHLDNWQVILMLIGCGGTGKSTINNIVRMFYDHEDVGILSNNHQKTFGLADIYDKFAFIAPEIKRDWNIDQAEFQEIVSGGKININIKHKSSQMVQWTAPGMLGGNENPGFVDNATSIQRRVVITRFDHKVQNVLPDLHVQLENEISQILKSCNLLYLHYNNKYRNVDIWNWLPTYFKDTQNIMANSTNSLHAFINSSLVLLHVDKYIPMSVFFKYFNTFCYENNLKKQKINVDFYQAPFDKFKISVVTKDKVRYAGNLYKNEQILYGIDMVANQYDSVNDE
jgi:hypothetical protein